MYLCSTLPGLHIKASRQEPKKIRIQDYGAPSLIYSELKLVWQSLWASLDSKKQYDTVQDVTKEQL